MGDACAWWAGDDLGQTRIALAVFSQQVEASEAVNRPALGAVSTGTRDVLLRPDQISSFLWQHQNAVLVCYNAAELHWLLEAHLRNDVEALRVLWAYSREARLVDIMLLDQHIRHLAGEGASPRQLSELVMCTTGERLQPDSEVRGIVAAAWTRANETPSAAVETVLKAVVAGILKSYEHLLTEAQRIEDCLARANHFSDVPPTPPPPDVADKIEALLDRNVRKALAHRQEVDKSQTAERGDDANQEKSDAASFSFGPLGIGIDIQGAIAVAQPHRPILQGAPQQLGALQAKNLDRFKEASRKLHRDVAARKCFHWCRGQGGEVAIQRNHNSPLDYETEAMRGWLAGFRKRLSDIHNLAAEIPTTPEGFPSFDPERWGVWASCDRSLAAWRDLSRSVLLDCDFNANAEFRPLYDIVPAFRSRHPELVAFRSLGVPFFRPSAGHVFLVGILPLLRICCYAAVHRDRHVPKRLVEYYFEDEDPIGKIADELYTYRSGEEPLSSEEESDAAETPPLHSPVEEAVAEFDALEQSDPTAYRQWRWITQALLEVIPLGLHDTLLGVCLEQDYGLDAIQEVEVGRLKEALVEHVIYEIKDFLDDRVLDRLGSVLRLTVPESVEKLAKKEHWETTDAALRNALLRKRKKRPVWRFIQRTRQNHSASDLPTDDQIIEKVMQRCAKTPAGRVVGPAFYTEARRQEMRLAADEVMKSVVYTVVAAGLPLAAVVDNEFVLEVREAEATDGLMHRVRELVIAAGRKVLGPLSPGCTCEWTPVW